MKKTFDLYIDESGTFSETERARGNQNFANQLAGILVPVNELTEENAEQILRTSYSAARYSMFPAVVHGQSLNSGSGYDRLINKLVAQIKQRRWQPVRLINQESIDYGDSVSNYVNMLAELALRIYQQELKKGADKIILNFYCAVVHIGGHQKILEQDYLRALRNYLAFAAVRLGLAAESSRWKIGIFRLLSANRSRRLQICDLLSNASHDQYQKCGEQTAFKLKTAFGVYDQTLVKHPLFEKLSLFIEEGSWGLAIRTIAERLVKDRHNGNDHQSEVLQHLDSLIDTLANLTATERDSHLNILIAWLEQIISQQRSLDLGYEIILWLRGKLNQPLIDKLEDRKTSLCWFTYALHFWALTICNHQGNLDEARKEANAMKQLLPNLAGHWELVPLLMRGLVAEAVHYTDCWEYYEVAKSMYSVVKYYSEISSLFIDALPTVFPQRIRSQLKAKALGTWLQSEIHASAFLPHRVLIARNISDVCINEFSTFGDKQRQYQYRAQLETIAEEFETARKYLAKSLDLPDNSHNAIAQQITTLKTKSQGFALLHWLRLGTTAFLSDRTSEWSEFSQALEQSKLLNNYWCQGNKLLEYPTHGILRRVALVNTIWHRPNSALGRLRNLDPVGKQNIVFGAIQVATYAEIAALKWENNIADAKLLLDCTERRRLGLLQLTQKLSNKSKTIFPRFWRLTQLWSKSIQDILNCEFDSGREVKRKLLKIGATVNY